MKEKSILFGGLEDRIKGAIAEEKEAIDDYAELENILNRAELSSQAFIVNEIRNDELDHRKKFEIMFETIFRKKIFEAMV